MIHTPSEKVIVRFGSDMELSANAGDLMLSYLKTLTIEPQPAKVTPIQRIGSEWFEQGGIYAGMVRGDEGHPDYHLIVLPEQASDITWNGAMAWAKNMNFAGHVDYSLPRRKEQSVLFGNVPEMFEKSAYWSCEQHATNSDGAWCQNFVDGYQGFNVQICQLRARLVRRLIFSF